jgi:predicted secreted protein
MLPTVCLTAILIATPPARGAAMDKAETPVIITEKDDGSTIEVAKGRKVVVKLEVQLGTGFSWRVKKSPDFLKQEGKPKIEPKDKTKRGGKADQVFSLGAGAVGSGKLELEYVRPFEKEPKPAKTFCVEVKVE